LAGCDSDRDDATAILPVLTTTEKGSWKWDQEVGLELALCRVRHS
jgi:hypothetical protein